MVKCITSLAAIAAAVTTNWAIAEVSQVHLGVSSPAVDCPNGIAVSFATNVADPYLVTATGNGVTMTVHSTFISYSVSEPEHSYSYTSAFLHTALLCNLADMTRYSYTIGQSEFTSSFMSLPHPGSSNMKETILGVVGDLGSTDDSAMTLAEQSRPFEGKNIHALAVVGDYSYANGQHELWDTFFQNQQGLLSRYPMMGINGYHETITTASFSTRTSTAITPEAENYLGYLKRVYTPITSEAKNALQTWYSVDVGLIHCVFLDDYTGSRGTNQAVVGTSEWLADRNMQLEWLKSDLASVNRSITPWVIVLKHNPYYNSWTNHQCMCSPTAYNIDADDVEKCWNGTYYSANAYFEPQCGLMAKFEDVFSANGVNIMITGHVHAYERTAKIFKNAKDATKGVYHVTTGSGGNGEGHAGPRLSQIPTWSLFSNSVTFGGSRLIATFESLRFLWFANDLGNAETVPTDGFTIFANGLDSIAPWHQVASTSL